MSPQEQEDKYYALKRVLGKIYFTGNFEHKNEGLKKRYAHKILDHKQNEYLLQSEEGLGISYSGLRQLKALFYEDSRKIEKLIIQEFGVKDNPLENTFKKASFTGKEVERLYFFLKGIKEADFPNENKFNVKDAELAKMLLDAKQTSRLVQDNLELIQDALKNNITTKDLINFGYRKGQLNIFQNLVNDLKFFDEFRKELKISTGKEVSEEKVWQTFFEANTWILGYGLDYIFNTELDGEKLERVTSGANFSQGGKRIDALLKSMGAINSLCFCELKLNSDPLLKKVKNSYRGESWQISDELSGAIAQVQRTVHKAVKDLSTKIELKDNEDNLTGEELYFYNPKAFIIIGNLSEFQINGKINEIKFSSFEMFRKSFKNIEIITYDELYQRAYHICHVKE